MDPLFTVGTRVRIKPLNDYDRFVESWESVVPFGGNEGIVRDVLTHGGAPVHSVRFEQEIDGKDVWHFFGRELEEA